MLVFGYAVDSDKVLGSSEQRYHNGSYAFVGFPKGFSYSMDYDVDFPIPRYMPQGSFLSLADSKKYKRLNLDALIEVCIDDKCLIKEGNFYFPKYGCKYHICEYGYKPNRLNKNRYF